MLSAMVNLGTAQSVSLSVKAGLNMSSLQEIALIQDGQAFGAASSLPSKPVTGFNAGIFADMAFGHWSVQSGLVYTGIGGQNNSAFVPATLASGTNVTFYGYDTDKLNYLQLPVDVLYHVPVNFGYVFMGLGPYLGYGLSGTKKILSYSIVNGTSTPTAERTYPDKFGSNAYAAEFKKFDWGTNALLGVELKNKISLSIGYNYGLANVSNSNGENRYRNKTLQLSIGYAFSFKRN